MRVFALAVIVATSSCAPPAGPSSGGGGGGPPAGGGGPGFTVGGRVQGYDASLGALALTLNAGEPPLTLSGDGAFVFPTSLAPGTSWAVTVTTQPAEQRCTVLEGTGTIATANVESVQVRCVTNAYPVGGLARGVDRVGLSLREDVSNQLLSLGVDAGAFAFATPVPFGALYDVRLDSSPTGRDCIVSFGSGTVQGATTDVRVDCAARQLALTVTMEGVDVEGVRLTEATSMQTLTVDAGATSARFGAPLLWESNFAVSVSVPANTGRTCGVDGGTGTVLGPLVAPHVKCELQRFVVGGVLTGSPDGSVALVEQTTGQRVDAGVGPFTFGAPIPWGTAIDVQVDAQPANTFCRVDGGVRVVQAAVSDVAVTCAAGFPVSGRVRNLRGAGLVITQASTGQQVAPTQTGASVDFRFPFVVPAGEPLGVAIATQPQGQTCRVDTPAATPVSAASNEVVIQCGPRTTGLVINEVAAVPSPQTPFWVELYNGTAQPIALADFTLRAPSRFTDGGVAGQVAFQLPDASVPPASAFVVSGKPFADLHDSPSMRFLVQGNATPAPGGPLSLERAGQLVDAVAFEDAGVAVGWQGNGLVLPEGAGDFGRSLARTQGPDTNGAADFQTCDFPTPGGLNDVCTSVDADQDGLPDVAEAAGTTWNELPLYDWGARPSQRDLFIEVDWLPPDGFNGTFDPAILPRREALERVRDVYAAHGLVAHFDTGALYHPAPGLSPADFDLGGGNQTAWGCTVSLAGTASATSFYKLKADNADLRRRLSFHHALFANSLADVACGGAGGTSGVAELGGNDLAITLGRSSLTTATTTGLNQVINWQSATLMHELGHNLGLRHGGFEDRGYKPNYLSVMNYMYQFDGLPVLGPNEGDRYYRQFVLFGVCSGAPGITSAGGLTRSRFSTPATWGLDYSDGSSVTLNEAALVESVGFGRAGSGSIDWNWNTTIDTANVSADVDALSTTPRVCPRTNAGVDLVRDHDDWGAVVLTFSRTARGSASGGNPRRLPLAGPLRFDVYGDRQPLVNEQPVPLD